VRSLTPAEADELMIKGSRQRGAEVRTSLAGKGRGGGAAHSRKEREIQAAILAFLRTVPGVVAWRNNTGAVSTGHRFVRFGFRGASDIVGFTSGAVSSTATVPAALSHVTVKMPPPSPIAIFLAIEVKREGHYPTAEQQAFLDIVKQAGGIAICAHSVEDVAVALGLRPTPAPGGAGELS